MEQIGSDEITEAVANHYRRLASGDNDESMENDKRRLVEIDKKVSRLADLISESSKPGALLRQIESLEGEREGIQSW